jgi:hypothetical protein
MTYCEIVAAVDGSGFGAATRFVEDSWRCAPAAAGGCSPPLFFKKFSIEMETHQSVTF